MLILGKEISLKPTIYSSTLRNQICPRKLNLKQVEGPSIKRVKINEIEISIKQKQRKSVKPNAGSFKASMKLIKLSRLTKDRKK